MSTVLEMPPDLEPTTKQEQLRCDVLLFVAATTEKDQLKIAASELGIVFTKRHGNFGTYYDLGLVGASRVMAVKTDLGPLSFNGSASRAIHAMIETAATGLISLGMAFGIDRNTQGLGNVVVSRTLLPYDKRTVLTKDGNVYVDYSEVVPYKSKASLVQMLEREAEAAEWVDKVSFGAMLTGAAKIQCTTYRNELVVEFSDSGEPVVGGEMEGVGMLATCDESAPVWIVVKGISDYADEKSDEDVKVGRTVACHNSARFVLQALKKVPL